MSDISKENPNKKARLGRGLGSLLGGAAQPLPTTVAPPPVPSSAASSAAPSTEPSKPAAATPAGPPKMASQTSQTLSTQPPVQQVPPEARIWQVGIDKLMASEFQPRSHFEKEKLEELSASIKQNGILQPIVARKLPSGRFEIIAGERRWRAAQLAGLHEVPVILKNIQNQAALELAIIENIQREDLNPIEEAEAYQRLASEFDLTQMQVAEKVGKDRATVANAMRLLALPNQVREMIIKSEISAGHAKVLLSLNNPAKQVEFAKRIAAEKISVRQLEKMVSQDSLTSKASQEPKPSDSNVSQKLIANLTEELQRALGTKVSIDYLNSKGKVSVHFYSDAELNKIVERLKEAHGKH